MCGIAGLWRLDGARAGDGERLEKMATSLVHRGPDDFGYLLAGSQHGLAHAGKETSADFSPDVLLASRRLCITDLSPAGRQPIANETDDIFVVFNGAIHNYLELQSELKRRGHVFRTQTDTEVIVHAYEEWGEECARHFNGMWAYAIWDQKREQLVCSRDRFGIKPLLIVWQDNTFYFASEIKAILATGEVAPRANLSAVGQFLTGRLPGYNFQTFFEGIEQLQPGHNLVISRAARRETAYWSYTERSEDYDFDSPQDTLRTLFDDALQLRLRSEVPIALLLSGGLDSSCIAVRARQAADEGALEVFAFASPDFKEDESRYASVVAKHSGLNFNVVELNHTALMEDLISATWHMEEPIAQAQIIARWQLLKATSEKARIVLEGQGADEILGGYPDRYRTAYMESERSGLSISNFHRKAPRLASAFLGLGSFSERSVLRPLGLLGPQPNPWRALLSPEFTAAYRPGPMTPLQNSEHFPDALTNELYKDCTRIAFPYLLHLGDAISMAHSVESRLPFLDHRLVEFAFGLPFDEKIRGRQTKYILRQAFANQLPAQIKRRGKVGFSLPLRQWLEPLIQSEIRPRLTARRVRERGIFNQAGLEQCFANFKAGQKGFSTGLLRCLALEIWFEKFIDGR